MAFDQHFGGTRGSVDGDGVRLNVVHAGEHGPLVLFVHGYPDTHAVWLPVMSRLVNEFRCVAYDVRGAGESDSPETVEGYRLPHLVNDLVAVIDDAAAPKVHLVGHDWGSGQAWEAVLMAGTDRRLRGRIASYTSISGPSTGHADAWGRRSLAGSWRQRRELAHQMTRSWYMAAFQLPYLPELAVRATLAGPERVRSRLGLRQVAPTIAKDAVNGLGLYRANLRDSHRERHPLSTDIPVQLIVPTQDPFLLPALYDDLPLWCSDLTRHDIDAGHWVQRSHPHQVAEWIAGFVRAHS